MRIGGRGSQSVSSSSPFLAYQASIKEEGDSQDNGHSVQLCSIPSNSIQSNWMGQQNAKGTPLKWDRIQWAGLLHVWSYNAHKVCSWYTNSWPPPNFTIQLFSLELFRIITISTSGLFVSSIRVILKHLREAILGLATPNGKQTNKRTNQWQMRAHHVKPISKPNTNDISHKF